MITTISNLSEELRILRPTPVQQRDIVALTEQEIEYDVSTARVEVASWASYALVRGLDIMTTAVRGMKWGLKSDCSLPGNVMAIQSMLGIFRPFRHVYRKNPY